MNAVVEPRTGGGATLARQIRATEDSLLGPLKAVEALGRNYPQWAHAAYERRADWKGEILYARSEDGGVAGLVTLIENRVDRLPPEGELAAVAEPYLALTMAKADSNKNRLLLGMLIDAFPNARPLNPAGYFERLVHEITDAGYSPSIVAMAAKDLVRKCTFPPSIAEAVEACNSARDTLEGTRRLILSTYEAREHMRHGLELARAAEEEAHG